MAGILDRFVIPSAQPEGQQVSVQFSGSSGVTLSNTQEIPIVPHDPIRIDSNRIPDYVYNEANSGYAAMFSPTKIGISPNSEGIVLSRSF